MGLTRQGDPGPYYLDQIIDSKRYQTEKARLIASDAHYSEIGTYWIKTKFLLRTPKGNYFLQHQGNGSSPTSYRIEPIDRDRAIQSYSKLPRKELDFPDAFPGVQIPDA